GRKDYKMESLKEKVQNSDLNIKYKLKISIPLFLFTKYESEIELTDKIKLPFSLKELSKIVF
ncbi:MAG: hypothetical protein KDD99_33130, partial [Bacteroidetes bacterium]|nr:hypothetical protein [Bacteroidota bacterium]